MSHPRTALAVAALTLLWTSAPATAQPIGTFRWQLLPYCNVVTLNITQQGSIYTLDGTDDRCGDAQAASARGMAFLNPNGMVGLGVTMVQPGGTPVHFEATISLSSLGGSWRDSLGAAGSLVFLPGAGIGGSPRPVAPGGLPPGAVTSLHLANGAVGAAAVAVNAIAGSNVVDGSLTQADLSDAPKVTSVENLSPSGINLPNNTMTVVSQVSVAAPAPGRVIVSTSGSFHFDNPNTPDHAVCSLTTGVVTGYPAAARAGEWNPADLLYVPFGGTRTFTVAAGSSTTFRLVCWASGSSISVVGAVLTALFVAGS